MPWSADACSSHSSSPVRWLLSSVLARARVTEERKAVQHPFVTSPGLAECKVDDRWRVRPQHRDLVGAAPGGGVFDNLLGRSASGRELTGEATRTLTRCGCWLADRRQKFLTQGQLAATPEAKRYQKARRMLLKYGPPRRHLRQRSREGCSWQDAPNAACVRSKVWRQVKRLSLRIFGLRRQRRGQRWLCRHNHFPQRSDVLLSMQCVDSDSPRTARPHC